VDGAAEIHYKSHLDVNGVFLEKEENSLADYTVSFF
jgi:hypothetical protein